MRFRKASVSMLALSVLALRCSGAGTQDAVPADVPVEGAVDALQDPDLLEIDALAPETDTAYASDTSDAPDAPDVPVAGPQVLEPTGEYVAITRLDFTNALPGQPLLADPVAAFAADPGGAVVERLLALITDHVVAAAGAVDPVWLGQLDDELTLAATDWLTQHPPHWTACFVQEAANLPQMMTAVELPGTMTLFQVYGQVVNGQEQWAQVELFWPAGCATIGACGAASRVSFSDTCAPDAQGSTCRCVVPMTDVSDFPGGFVAGHFNGFVVDEGAAIPEGAEENQFVVSQHEVLVNLGALLRHVIDGWLTVRATGGSYDDLATALTAIVDCDAVVGGLSAGILAQGAPAGLDLPTLHALCTQAVAGVLAPVTSSLDGLSFGHSFWLNGGALLVDDDHDLRVDRLAEGFWNGWLMVNGLASSSFEGTFEAKRVP